MHLASKGKYAVLARVSTGTILLSPHGCAARQTSAFSSGAPGSHSQTDVRWQHSAAAQVSTGTKAVFLSPTDALHGDIGIKCSQKLQSCSIRLHFIAAQVSTGTEVVCLSPADALCWTSSLNIPSPSAADTIAQVSTGTKAVFLSPTDALHGDIGIVGREDLLVAFSKSGASEELLKLLPFAKVGRVALCAWLACVGTLSIDACHCRLPSSRASATPMTSVCCCPCQGGLDHLKSNPLGLYSRFCLCWSPFPRAAAAQAAALRLLLVLDNNE